MLETFTPEDVAFLIFRANGSGSKTEGGYQGTRKTKMEIHCCTCRKIRCRVPETCQGNSPQRLVVIVRHFPFLLRPIKSKLNFWPGGSVFLKPCALIVCNLVISRRVTDALAAKPGVGGPRKPTYPHSSFQGVPTFSRKMTNSKVFD